MQQAAIAASWRVMMIRLSFTGICVFTEASGVGSTVGVFITTMSSMTSCRWDSIQSIRNLAVFGSEAIIEKNKPFIKIFDTIQALFLLKPEPLRTKALPDARTQDQDRAHFAKRPPIPASWRHLEE